MFSFPDHCEAGKYDEWAFYRSQFQSVAGGSKAVDILCVADDTAWLIEVKDYRRQTQKPDLSKLSDEIAGKVRDTLSGLAAARANANCREERALARRALARRCRWRVALHLEQPRVRTRLRPQSFNVADVLLKLRSRKLKAVDAHPVVLDSQDRRSNIPWTVR